MSADIFISYSRIDGDFARAVALALCQSGRSCWLDVDDIPPAERWREEIRTAIKKADVLVFVISPDSIASKVCALELEHAVALKKRIVPVIHRDVPAEAAPEALAALNWVAFRPQDKFDEAFNRLTAALDLVPRNRYERFMENLPFFGNMGMKFNEPMRRYHAFLGLGIAILAGSITGGMIYALAANGVSPLGKDINSNLGPVGMALVAMYCPLIGMRSRKAGRIAKLALVIAAANFVATAALLATVALSPPSYTQSKVEVIFCQNLAKEIRMTDSIAGKLQSADDRTWLQGYRRSLQNMQQAQHCQ